MSLRLRVTLLAAGVVAIIVAAFGTAVYLIVASRSISDVDDRLRARADGFIRPDRAVVPPDRVRQSPAADAPTGTSATSTAATPGGAAPTGVPRQVVFFPFRGPANELGFFILTHGTDGSVVSRSSSVTPSQVPVGASDWRRATNGDRPIITVESGGTAYRVTIRAVPADALPGTTAGATLDASIGQPLDAYAIGTSISDQETTLSTLRVLLLAGGVIATLLAAGGAWLISRRALRPVSRLLAAAETIGSDGDLGRRLPVPRTGDEISRLSVAFNGSLERVERTFGELETLLEQHRRFVADASHELRTPLTTLRTDLGSLRRHLDLDPEERATVLDEALVELERLSTLVADLLLLARADAGVLLRSGPLSWDDLVAEVLADAERICAPRPVVDAVTHPLGLGTGDGEALRRAVRAMLENAAHHTPQDTTVRIAGHGEPAMVVVSVEDDGPGVDASLLPRLFDRFVQADVSRHTTGTGLGLSIARGIVEAHGGTVTARIGEGGGLIVEMRLPRGQGGETAAPSPAAPVARQPALRGGGGSGASAAPATPSSAAGSDRPG